VLAKYASRACRILGWLTAALVILGLVSGYGVTEFRVVTPLTLRLLTKATAEQLHDALAIPLVVVLLLHLSASLLSRRSPTGSA
jgi:hypothetical protein